MHDRSLLLSCSSAAGLLPTRSRSLLAPPPQQQPQLQQSHMHGNFACRALKIFRALGPPRIGVDMPFIA